MGQRQGRAPASVSDVAEVLFHNRQLSGSEITSIESYIATRYAL
jgi:hypothetical protein